jgi:hypothetical protein
LSVDQLDLKEGFLLPKFVANHCGLFGCLLSLRSLRTALSQLSLHHGDAGLDGLQLLDLSRKVPARLSLKVQRLLAGTEFGCEHCSLLVQPGQLFLHEQRRSLRVTQFGLQSLYLLFVASSLLVRTALSWRRGLAMPPAPSDRGARVAILGVKPFLRSGRMCGGAQRSSQEVLCWQQTIVDHTGSGRRKNRIL